MAFELKSVVPWGRTLDEYKKMFSLTTADMDKRIASFGDGPASFNAEMTKLNKKVISFDPIYQFSENELRQRIIETKDIVIRQMRENTNNFVWNYIRDVEELEQIRAAAMSDFIDDFENGKEQKRYIFHKLPEPIEFNETDFDLGLSSHFLILYSQLGIDFHIKSISEMLRICREIRIFPLLNLNAEKSEVLKEICDYFSRDYAIEILKVDYEFQKNGNEMLIVKRAGQ